MFLREAPTSTLATIREAVESEGEVLQVSHSEVRLDLDGEGTITVGDTTLPASSDAVAALGGWLDVPRPFLMRIEPDLRQHVLSTLLQRQPATAAFVVKDEQITEVRDPNKKVIPVRSLIDTAIKVIDPTAPVIEHWATGEEFRLDVMAPEGFDRSIGGDWQVGDITRGGIRIGQNRKANLAPWVQPYAYRLICTNGMTTTDDGLKVDARGGTVEEVLAAFENAADRAFRRVEDDIRAFYDLRTQPVPNPERTLLRMARESGLPERTVLRLAAQVPAMVEAEEVSMFHLVNLITNQANDPSIRTRRGARDGLEAAGGAIVSQHAERCGHCQSRLN